MKNEDKGRKWMWWFLGSLTALQSYFVRELLTLLALFAVGFAALAMLGAGGYVMYRGLEAGLAQVARQAGPVFTAAQRGLAFAEELGRKPFRRPGSEPAQ